MITVHPAYVHPGSIDSVFQDSLDGVISYDQSDGPGHVIPIPLRVQSGLEVWKGRNDLTAAFLERSPADAMLMIDTDMGFAPDTAHRLAEHCTPDTPVIGGLCFAHRRRGVDPATNAQRFTVFPTLYRWHETEHGDVGFSPAQSYQPDTLVDVDGTGAAMLLIHRTVLEEIGRNWWTHVPKGETGDRFSEDFSFCMRVVAAGWPIRVHTGVKTCHKKTVYLDEPLFAAQQAVAEEQHGDTH